MAERIEGMRKLRRKLKKLEKVPQKHVTATARKAMNIVLKDARKNAPVDTGELKGGMKLLGERSKFKGKKVYRVVFDSAKNHIFQKTNDEGDVIAYYPISQEYGYFLRDGQYMPGLRFIRNALEDNKSNVEKTIVSEMTKRVEKELRG